MKKHFLIFASFFTLLLAFTSCQNDLADGSDQELIQEIAEAAKTSVEVSALPQPITTSVENAYFETFIETALLARGKGYQINMEDGQTSYFNTAGTELQARGGKKGGHGGHGTEGYHVSIDSLSANITTYISTNYPNDTIRRAKFVDNEYWVGLSSHTIVIFDAAGNFLRTTTAEQHSCGGGGKHGEKGEDIAIADLPAVITAYITTNYSGATTKRARYIPNEKYVVGILLADGTKKLLVFDAAGTFLYERTKRK